VNIPAEGGFVIKTVSHIALKSASISDLELNVSLPSLLSSVCALNAHFSEFQAKHSGRGGKLNQPGAAA